MKTLLVACETLKDELQWALKQLEMEFETVWIESGLHNWPEKLRDRQQVTLNAVEGFERVIFAFGLCGNSALGLETRDFELIIPRVDDCISLLIGSMEKRVSLGKDGGVYFLTPGWLRGERNIYVEYQYTVDKYGAETAETIMKSMLGQYKYLGVLDSGSYDMDVLTEETYPIAHQLKLEHKIVDASVDYVKALLTGPWSEDRFVITPPNSVVEEFQLEMSSAIQ